MLRNWDELPAFMQVEAVRPYWEALRKKRGQILLKRVFDFITALILLLIVLIPMVVIAIWIKIDSKGPVFFSTGTRHNVW